MGTSLNPDLLANADVLGTYDFQASDGVQYKVVARIRAVVDGTPAVGTAAPVKLEFYTMNSSGTLTLAFTLSAAQAATLVGAQTFTGGIAQATAPHGFYNWQAATATSGTDTTPANGTQFVSSIFVPANKTLTGIGYLIGSVGGTDKVYAVLYSATGALLANSSVTGGGATVGTAANIQTLAFTSTYAATGPAMYYIGISMNGNTARLRSVPAHCQGGLFAGSVSQTHGTVAAITAPTTFTADKGPVAFVY